MTLSKDQRLRWLIKRGHFPTELPPPFHTDDLARCRNSVLQAWQGLQPNQQAQLEPYSVPKIGAHRRTLATVNPIVQTRLAKLIADEWVTIRSFLRRSKIALEPVEIVENANRAIPIPNFNLLELKQLDILAQYDFIVSADTSRFYSTIYTHSIPWALHGKAWCKEHLKGKKKAIYDATLGARLDTALRYCQENQSIGMPVGPDTSRILSEILAVAIDVPVVSANQLAPTQAFRNVDDWFVGLDSSDAGDLLIASIAAELTKYGLEIHPHKTRIQKSLNSPPDLWPADLRCCTVDTNSRNQRSDLVLFIEKAFAYSRSSQDENVLNFAVKVSSSFAVSDDNWPIYEAFLLRCARYNASTLPVVSKILKRYSDKGYDLGKERIAKLASDLITRNAPFGHHFEVAWSLFLLRTLGISLSPQAARAVSKMESSACALVALDCREAGLVSTGLNVSGWRKALSAEGLWSGQWLLAYEADLKGWLAPAAGPFVEHDSFFAPIKAKTISFYDRQRSVGLVQTRKWASKNEGVDEFLQLLEMKAQQERFTAFPSLFDDDDFGSGPYPDF
jgi:hypothetical protein